MKDQTVEFQLIDSEGNVKHRSTKRIPTQEYSDSTTLNGNTYEVISVSKLMNRTLVKLK